MNKIVASFIKKYPEHYVAQIFSRIFWPPPTVVVLAFGENDDVLALDLNGGYRLPGGFLDKGDDLKQAAAREVKEKTGYEVEVKELLDIRHNESGGPQMFFEGLIVGGEKKSSWEGEVEFIPREEIKERVWKLDHSHIHEYLFPEN